MCDKAASELFHRTGKGRIWRPQERRAHSVRCQPEADGALKAAHGDQEKEKKEVVHAGHSMNHRLPATVGLYSSSRCPTAYSDCLLCVIKQPHSNRIIMEGTTWDKKKHTSFSGRTTSNKDCRCLWLLIREHSDVLMLCVVLQLRSSTEEIICCCQDDDTGQLKQEKTDY